MDTTTNSGRDMGKRLPPIDLCLGAALIAFGCYKNTKAVRAEGNMIVAAISQYGAANGGGTPALAFGTEAAANSKSHSTFVWDLSNGAKVQTIPGILSAIALSPDGRLVALRQNGKTSIWRFREPLKPAAGR